MEDSSYISNFKIIMFIQAFLYKLKKNVYGYFFAKIFVVIIFVFCLDFLIGSALETLYFKQESGLLYRTTYSIEKTTADLLIFGSSTATHDYSPQPFESRLNTSYYNVGRDGNSIFYQYAILKAILKRYSPKIIILNFDLDEFDKTSEKTERLSSLLPYYKTHPEIRSIIEHKSHFEKFKLLSKIYPYNSSIFTIAVGNMEFNKKRSGDIKGYLPLFEEWKEPVSSGNFLNADLDSSAVNVYKFFIKDCISARVKLYVVCSPFFNKPDYLSNSILLGHKIATENKVNFFDYSKDSSLINNHSNFADIGHLNNNGAHKFSNMIIDRILKEGY